LEIAVNSKEVTLKLVQTEPDATGTRVSEVANTTPVPKVSKSSEKESVSVMGTKIAECWVDTLPMHIGIMLGSWYKTFALKEGWMTKTHDVNWAKTAAIRLDSATALLVLSGGKVRVPEIMESVHHMESILKSSNLTIKRVKVASKKNIAHQFSHAMIMNVEGHKELEGGLTIPDALAKKTHDINWAKTVAVELVVQIAFQWHWHRILKIKSDNQAAQLAMFGGKVRVPEIMELACHKDDILKTSNFTIEGENVSSKNNIAHQFSCRGIISVEGYEKPKPGITTPEALVPFMEEL
ncbi:hypothetical protein FRC11_012867, partial [Ceratobasidium sp. 423]